MKPICYILIGVPGSGKSTWIQQQNFNWNNTVVASTDNYIESVAKKQHVTYSEAFKENMTAAVAHMANIVMDAIKLNKNIVWDQTSTTKQTRARKIRMLPSHYEVVAVIFPTPDNIELERRLNGRPGKVIPKDVMEKMIRYFELPTRIEGFERIEYAN